MSPLVPPGLSYKRDLTHQVYVSVLNLGRESVGVWGFRLEQQWCDVTDQLSPEEISDGQLTYLMNDREGTTIPFFYSGGDEVTEVRASTPSSHTRTRSPTPFTCVSGGVKDSESKEQAFCPRLVTEGSLTFPHYVCLRGRIVDRVSGGNCLPHKDNRSNIPQKKLQHVPTDEKSKIK